jgi:putative transposase
MAKEAMKEKELSIRQVCEAFSVSQGCFRYAPKLSSDNARIAELLLGLAQSQRNWGFGLCFCQGIRVEL